MLDKLFIHDILNSIHIVLVVLAVADGDDGKWL